jgi:hypothetical protein
VAVLVGPVFLSGGTLLTMNAFEQLLWPVCAFALVVALRDGSPRAWVGFGVAAGLALMNKHSTGFFLMALAAGLLLTPERRVLRTRWPWIAVGLACLVFAPNVVWQARHDWPTLEFLRNAAARKNYPVPPLEFLKAQVLLVHPLALPLWLAGLWFFLIDGRGRGLRLLGWAFVLLFVLFLVIKAKHYYLSPAYPMLMASGSVLLADRLSGRRGRALFVAALALLIAGGALLAPFALPVLPRDDFVRYSNRLGIREPPSERHRPARLPQTFADMFGWEEMTAAVARVYHSLSPEERARCTIYASNYGEAGAIDFFGPQYGLPRVTCGHNSYWLWGPPNPEADVVITVGEDVEDVEKACNRVEEAASFSHEWNMPYESDLPILIGRDFKLGWRDMWPATKEYI